MHRARALLVAAGIASVLLAGCSTGSTAATATGSSTPSTTPASGAGQTSSSTACGASAVGGVPSGAASKQTLDVDGDGRRDTVYIDEASGGAVRFGIVTASGGIFSTRFESASPAARSVLVADVTGKGELIALASDGRKVQLYAISQCAFVPVQNPQDEQYTFDLGFTGFGTGVGCTDVDGDGVRDLAGLLADGTTITTTAVVVNGPRATNGPSATAAGATPAQLDLAHQVTCGDLTMARDGVSTGP